MVIAQRDQSSDFGKAMDNILVGVENILPDPFRDTDFFRVPAVVVYRGKEREPILQTDLIVFFAVARSGVHAAGAGIERNMLAEQNDRVAIQEWVPAKPLVHFDAGQQSDWFTIPAPTGCMLKMAHQVIGQEESSWCCMVRMPKLVDQIFVRRMDRDCEVCRERPWRSGPDHDRSFARERTGPNSEIDVDRRVGTILVLDLRFREGSLRAGAPENRFLALVHKVSLHKTRENAKDNRLIRVIKRQVRMIPIAENPKSFELAPLDVDIFASVGLGTFPNLQRGETSGFFDHLKFDRQAVTIPSGNVRSSQAGHCTALDDEILKDLVQGGPHVNVSVREWRTVVQHE